MPGPAVLRVNSNMVHIKGRIAPGLPKAARSSNYIFLFFCFLFLDVWDATGSVPHYSHPRFCFGSYGIPVGSVGIDIVDKKNQKPYRKTEIRFDWIPAFSMVIVSDWPAPCQVPGDSHPTLFRDGIKRNERLRDLKALSGYRHIAPSLPKAARSSILHSDFLVSVFLIL